MSSKVYRVTEQGLQAMHRPALLQCGPDAFDFESLELARFALALCKKPKPRVALSAVRSGAKAHG